VYDPAWERVISAKYLQGYQLQDLAKFEETSEKKAGQTTTQIGTLYIHVDYNTLFVS